MALSLGPPANGKLAVAEGAKQHGLSARADGSDGERRHRIVEPARGTVQYLHFISLKSDESGAWKEAMRCDATRCYAMPCYASAHQRRTTPCNVFQGPFTAICKRCPHTIVEQEPKSRGSAEPIGTLNSRSVAGRDRQQSGPQACVPGSRPTQASAIHPSIHPSIHPLPPAPPPANFAAMHGVQRPCAAVARHADLHHVTLCVRDAPLQNGRATSQYACCSVTP